MFGRGLNATMSGGVLLKCDASAAVIISGPSAHSIRLNEYEFTIDPIGLEGIAVVETYLPSD